MEKKPNRTRPFLFSLKTVFVVMTLAAVLAAMAGSVKMDIESNGADKWWILLQKFAACILAPILAIIIMFADSLLTFDWFRKHKKTKREMKNWRKQKRDQEKRTK